MNTALPTEQTTASDSATNASSSSDAIRLLTVSEWKTALATFDHASIFHAPEWINLLASSYRYTPVLACLGAPESPQALLPVMEISSVLTGRRGVSLPFTDACEPLARSPEAARALLQGMLKLAETRNWKKIEFRGGSQFMPDAVPATAFYSHQLELKSCETILAKGLDSSVRRAVRKAEQAGVTIEFSSQPAAIERFYQLLALTRRRHGLPPQPMRFFSGLQPLLAAGQGTIVLAQLHGETIAGAVYLFSGKTVHYKYGASDERHQQVRGNNLVMWRAISAFAKQRYTHLDFGRTSLDNEGLRTFKLNWGTKESVIHYWVRDVVTQTWIEAPDRTSGWHTGVFRRLPLSLSRWIGNLLYRHIG